MHSSDLKASRARPRVMPCDRTRGPARPVPTQYTFGPVCGWRQPSGRRHQREELGEVVLLPGQRHLAQGGAVVGLHLGRCDGPAIERAFGEGHDLGAPDVRETPVRPGDHGRVGGSKRLDPGQLPGVTEGKIGAVGSLLRKSPTAGRDRLATDALEISRRPRRLGRGREPSRAWSEAPVRASPPRRSR